MIRPYSFQPENRLANALRKPGGVTLGEALARAERRLETVRDDCVAALDGKIEALAAIAAARDAAQAASAYAHASDIFSLSGTFGLKEFSEAAHSLCRLLDTCREKDGWSSAAARGREADSLMWQSVGVHIDALRTLRRPELSRDVAARAAVVEGLRRIAARATAGEASG